MAKLNPEALDLAVAREAAPKEQFCIVGKFVNGLDNEEFRTKVVAYLASDHQHTVLAAALVETTGVQLQISALSKHRRHECCCSEQV